MLVICLHPCCNGIWSLTEIYVFYWKDSRVLILVLMEYGLWHVCAPRFHIFPACVLILVLMEYGLWLNWKEFIMKKVVRLNPCSNGIWSLTHNNELRQSSRQSCLNPCSNGIWSLTDGQRRYILVAWVLILVLMEYGLWLCEVKLWHSVQHCLNPCSNGIWSLTYLSTPYAANYRVLILVLMEYGLWRAEFFGYEPEVRVLILVLMEYGLWPEETLKRLDQQVS